MRSRIIAVMSLAALGLFGVAIQLCVDGSSHPSATTVVPAREEAIPPTQESIREQKEEAARRRWPFESLVDRLPKGTPIIPSSRLREKGTEWWKQIDAGITIRQTYRSEVLRDLHERTREFFVESPGEGSVRNILLRRSEEAILLDESREGNTHQPGRPADFPTSPGEPVSRVKPDDEFFSFHEGGVLDFLYPRGFGFVRDRDHVSGFQSHGFREFGVEEHEKVHWRVQHIQLVGILSLPDPVVYLTDRLPSMEQVRQGKTRRLDVFEETALSVLKEGEDLFIVRKADTVRMLGALRATKTCQQCHNAGVGDLLGALSYSLRTAP